MIYYIKNTSKYIFFSSFQQINKLIFCRMKAFSILLILIVFIIMNDHSHPFEHPFSDLLMQGGSEKTANPAVYPTTIAIMTYPLNDMRTTIIETCKKA